MAWIAVGCTATVVVLFYNRVAEGSQLRDLFLGTVGFSILTLVLLLAAVAAQVPYASFALYVWKDVYIVILVEIFWTFANATHGTKSARWTYGLFCVMGSFGGISANLGVGYLAAWVGTENAVWLLVPLLFFTASLATGLPELARQGAHDGGAPRTFGKGLQLIRNSPYLTLILVLIVLVQVVVTLIDYQYNRMIEEAYPDQDARTAIMGQVYAFIDGASLVLQLGTGLVLARLGVSKVLAMIPLILASAVSAFVIAPRFITMAVAKVASKCFDYSLFRAAKEILYIPLNYDEKTQGKAVIDMLTYRVAKGGASLLIMVIAGGWVIYMTLGLTVL